MKSSWQSCTGDAAPRVVNMHGVRVVYMYEEGAHTERVHAHTHVQHTHALHIYTLTQPFIIVQLHIKDKRRSPLRGVVCTSIDVLPITVILPQRTFWLTLPTIISYHSSCL